MKIEQLPADTRAALDRLLEGVETALNADQESPHTSAVTYATLQLHQVDNPRPSLMGGSIEAPRKPPFDYDEDEIQELHFEVLKSDDRPLHTIIIHCKRGAPGEPWRLTPKLVSREAYKALAQAREALDKAIQGELAPVARGAERASFGRDNRGAKLRLVRSVAGVKGVADLEPTAALVQLFEKTEALYRDAGLTPIVLYWTLRGRELDLRDYFE